jgi:hypothetical protein
MKKAPATHDTTDTTTPTIAEAPVVQTPTEEPAGIALRDALLAFAVGIPNRVTLTDDDRAALGQLTALCGQYLEAATAAWIADAYYPQRLPDACQAFAPLLADFVEDTRGVEVHVFSSGRTVETLAIENPSLRAHFVKFAAEILRQIDAAIAAGQNRLRVESSRREDELQRIKVWLQIEPANLLIRELVVLGALTSEGKPMRTPLGHTLQALGLVFDRLEDDNTQRLPIGGSAWRRWLPVAARLLATPDGAGNQGQIIAA